MRHATVIAESMKRVIKKLIGGSEKICCATGEHGDLVSVGVDAGDGSCTRSLEWNPCALLRVVEVREERGIPGSTGVGNEDRLPVWCRLIQGSYEAILVRDQVAAGWEALRSEERRVGKECRL